MKRTALLIASFALFSAAAGAQNILGGILNSVGSGNVGETITNVISSVAGSRVDLAGTWTYGGVGAAVKSDNILSTVAGNAAITTVETKADEILAKAGVVAGSGTFTFNPDGTFSFKAGKLPAFSGTWSQNGNAVTLKFGKVLSSLQMDGTVSAAAGGCKILFDGEKFMTFAQTVIEYAQKITTSAGVAAVGNLLSTAKSVDVGFKLTR